MKDPLSGSMFVLQSFAWSLNPGVLKSTRCIRGTKEVCKLLSMFREKPKDMEPVCKHFSRGYCQGPQVHPEEGPTILKVGW